MILRYFEVMCDPRGKGRPRARAIKVKDRWTAIVYTDGADKTYEAIIREAYLRTYHDIPPLMGSVSIHIEAMMPIPKSGSRKSRLEKQSGKVPHTAKPDVDNIAKSVLDALNKLAFEDDSNVTELVVNKAYAKDGQAGLRVWIRKYCEGDV